MVRPIVLIVDDEPSFGLRLKEAFVLSPMWGCLFVDDLSWALKTLQQEENIGILLADWRFTKGYSVKDRLYDGIDLIKRVKQNNINVHCFLMTAQKQSSVFERKMKELDGVPLLHKQDFELSQSILRQQGLIYPGESENSLQPWDVIANNVVQFENNVVQFEKARAKSTPSITGIQIASELRHRGGTIVTYIQELSSKLYVRKPIEIHVEEITEDGSVYFRASAPTLGLLVSGFGDDPLDAINELQIVISDHFENLNRRDDLEAAAKHAQDLLREHINYIDKTSNPRFKYG